MPGYIEVGKRICSCRSFDRPQSEEMQVCAGGPLVSRDAAVEIENSPRGHGKPAAIASCPAHRSLGVFSMAGTQGLSDLRDCEPVSLNEEIALAHFTRSTEDSVHPRASPLRIDEEQHRLRLALPDLDSLIRSDGSTPFVFRIGDAPDLPARYAEGANITGKGVDNIGPRSGRFAPSCQLVRQRTNAIPPGSGLPRTVSSAFAKTAP